MQTALVTGATGFIGGHLVEALRGRGVAVRCAVRARSRTERLRELGVELTEADLGDPEGLGRAARGVDVVFHLAARTAAVRPSELMQVNALGSANLARACANQKTPPVLIYVSSIAAAGPTQRGRCRTEREAPAPVSLYGRSKRGGELAIQQWARWLPATIVRPAITFGFRNRELLPIFRGIARTHLHLVPFFSPPPLSFVEVRDLVRLLLAAAERGRRLTAAAELGQPQQGIYFACHDLYPDYRKLGRMIADGLGVRHLVYLHLGHPLPWLAGGAGQLAGTLLGKDLHVNVDKMREAAADCWACSPALAFSELDFRCEASLPDQLKSTARWYRSEGWL